VRIAARIDERFPRIAGARSVWTTGRIDLDPGAPSIIPGAGSMLFQFRDEDAGQLEIFERALRQIVEEADAAGPCRCQLDTIDRAMPKRMARWMQDAIEQAAERHAPGLHTRMPSGAAHDAQIMAGRVPAAMLFVPSIGGISHHYSEDTAEADIILGCRVFASAVERMLIGA
jgi:N-carbamoyl-L-amino-acid hydrolase